MKLVRADGTFVYCTLNSVVERAGVKYGITAGHCLSPQGAKRTVKILGPDDRTVIASDMRDSGWDLQGKRVAGAPFRDAGWFRLDPGVDVKDWARGGRVTLHKLDKNLEKPINDALAAVNRPIAIGGRMPVTAVRPGQIVCKDGGRTGRTCGPVWKVNVKTGEIFSFTFSIPGDSGSPVYVIGGDGKAYIVGIHDGGATPFESYADAALPLPSKIK
ncbi:hypothetical protein CAQUA_10970 [Corynebacterium aquatimens]|nr:hypothetical protein CAQUA_10970 [Corynebacterium aquatimens]